MFASLKKLIKDESGATAIEYGLIAALISVAAIGAFMAVGSSLTSTFMPTHNHQDWIRFLKLIHKQTPQDKDVHLILDNYSAHKAPKCGLGWPSIPAFTCISRPPVPPGSTRCSASSAISPTSVCAGACFTTFGNSSNPSRSISTSTTAHPSLICGQPKPGTSWRR